MNNARRKQIAAIEERVSKVMALIEGIRDDVEGIMNDEQEAYDNMPEALQEGEKGEKAQAAIDALQDAYNDLDGIVSTLTDDVTSHFSTATE